MLKNDVSFFKTLPKEGLEIHWWGQTPFSNRASASISAANPRFVPDTEAKDVAFFSDKLIVITTDHKLGVILHASEVRIGPF